MKSLALVLAILVSSSLLMGCDPSCVEYGYSRSARGSADYVASGMKDGEVEGAFPVVITMHEFNPFCDGDCDVDGALFELEAGPLCRLQVKLTSREYDRGRYAASGSFLQASAAILSGPCQLGLDDNRRVRGTVDGGTFEISPGSADLTFTVRVEEWGGKPSPGFLKLRFDGHWL